MSRTSSRRSGPFTPYTRLTEPLVRDAGSLRPATWDEALERAAGGLTDALGRGGPDSIGMFACSKATNEINYAAQKFARAVLGTNNIDSCNRT
jgi:predicted molibdopterin-dependent oxidoreductase YjgC